MKRILFLLLCAAVFSACAAPKAVIKPGFDISKVRTIKVGDFSSPGTYANAGPVVANEFMRQLLASGYNVVTGTGRSADVVLEGNVTEYLPNHRYLVQKSSGTNVVVAQPPLEISGSNMYNLGTVFGLGGDSQIVVSNATVGISAYLRDPSSGEVLWSNTYAYEGLDLNTALGGTVRYLLASLKPK